MTMNTTLKNVVLNHATTFDCFAETFDEDKEGNFLVVLNQSAGDVDKISAFCNGPGAWVPLADGRVVSVSALKTIRYKGESVVVGSLTGKTDAPSPVVLSSSLLTAKMISVFPLADATNYHMNFIKQADKDPEQAVLEGKTVDWVGINDPVFVSVPVMLPITPGSTIEVDEYDIKKPIVAEPGMERALVSFLKTVKFLYENTSSISLHAQSIKFDKAFAEPLANVDKNLLEKPFLPVDGLAISPLQDDELFRIAKAAFDDAKAAACLRVVTTCNLNSNGDAGISNSTLAQLTEAFNGFGDKISASRVALTGTEKEEETRMERAAKQFSLFFAYEDAEGKVHPNKLAKPFTTLLKTKSQANAHADFVLAMNNSVQMLTQTDGDNVWVENIHFDLKYSANQFFVTLLKTFRFSVESVLLEPDLAKTFVTLIAFLKAKPDTVKYEQVVRDSNTLEVEEVVAEATNKRGSKLKELPVEGSVDTVDDILCAFSNVYALANYCVEDIKTHRPILIDLLSKIRQLLTGKNRTWVEQRTKLAPHLPSMFLLEANVYFMFLAQIASNDAVLATVEAGSTVPKKLFEDMYNKLDNRLLQIGTTMTGAGLGEFNTVPAIYSLMSAPVIKIESEVEGGSPKKKRKTDSNDASPAKVSDGRSEEAIERAKKSGFLKATKPGQLRYFQTPVEVNGTKAKLCANFIYQGSFCTRGRDCKFHHVSKWDKLNTQEKHALIHFVDTDSGVEWADGKGPTPSSG